MQIQVIYSSTSGNTEIVVQHMASLLQENGCTCESFLAEGMDSFSPESNVLYVFASATYGHGVLQGRMRTFVEKTAKDVDLSGVDCVVVGLGDDKYDREYNVEAASILEDFVTTRGGSLVHETLRINRDPLDQLETRVTPWVEQLLVNSKR